MTSVYDFEAQQIDGKPVPLSKLQGQGAADRQHGQQCGFTPQFEGLEALHEKYAGQGPGGAGLSVATSSAPGPGQQRGDRRLLLKNYGVSFPMMEKIDVNGSGAAPLYKWLTKEAPGLLGSTAIKWNFTKFLVGKDGQVLKRYAPLDTPASMTRDIEAALAAG